MAIPFLTALPPVTPLLLKGTRPHLTVDLDHVIFVCHETAGGADDGSFTAHNSADGSGAEWHRTNGMQTGHMWRHTPAWDAGGWNWELSHDLNFNHASVGMENTGLFTNPTQALAFPLGLNSAAREVALMGVAKGRVPKRGLIVDPSNLQGGHVIGGSPLPEGWVIGHGDDAAYGGTSPHSCLNNSNWPWADFMALCVQWYDHLKGGDDLPDPRLTDEGAALMNALAAGLTEAEAKTRGAHLAGIEKGTATAEAKQPRPTAGNWQKDGYDVHKASNP